MAVFSNVCWLPGRLRHIVLATVLLLSLPAAVSATDVHYLRVTRFQVPFVINSAQQPLIERVVLWVSADYGRTYNPAAQAPPSSTSFEYTAPVQGWYWFTVQAEYKDGRRAPQDVRTVQAGLKIYVDTSPPSVTFRQIAPREGTLAVEWDVRDDYPDVLSLHIDYRASPSGTWMPLNVAKATYGQFSWTPTVNAVQYDVRLQVSDMAKNPAEKIIQVGPGQVPQQQGGGPPDPYAPRPSSRVTMLNTMSLKINYDVSDKGKSDVVDVQVWATQDTQSWKKVGHEVPKAPPCVNVQVDKEGRWGFKLIAVSGAGRSEPTPVAGQQPDFWVEIDTTNPEVKLDATEMSGDAKNPRMTIRWTAKDKHLADRPITISYSEDGMKWTQLATGLPNDGQYIWNVPPDVPFHKCFIKVDAVDQAGNVGSAQTPTAVIVELNLPKAHIIGVEGAAPQSGTPGPGAALTPPVMNPLVSVAPGGSDLLPAANITAIQGDPKAPAQGSITPIPQQPPLQPTSLPPSPPVGPVPTPPPSVAPMPPSTATPIPPSGSGIPPIAPPTALPLPAAPIPVNKQ